MATGADLRLQQVPRDRQASILYVVSRFPRLSETFVVREWWRLSDRFQLRMAALLEGDRDVVHPESLSLLPDVLFTPLLGRCTISANLSFLARRPIVYGKTFLAVMRGSFRERGGGTLKGAAVFWKSVRLAAYVRDAGIDHVHAHFLHHPATSAFVIHRLTGTPFSVTIHADDLFVGPALLAEKLAEATVLVTISEFNRSLIDSLEPGLATRVEVIHCGVDPVEFPYRERRTVRRLICVARLARTKGQDDLLRAFAIASQAEPGLTLDIVGGGADADALATLCRSLGLDDVVTFHGPLATPLVRRELDRADLFVLPARERPDGTLQTGRLDGIPVSLMEAMAAGLPVVSTRVSGIPELVVDGETGLLVEPDNPEELAEAILRLVRDQDLAWSVARRAREYVERRFNLEIETDKLAILLDETMAARATPDSVRLRPTARVSGEWRL